MADHRDRGRDAVTVHTHTDSQLTVGCPACIERRHQDQKIARWADAPLRRCTWKFTAGGDHYTFDLVVRVPAGATPWEVDEEWAEETGPEISNAIGAQETGDLFFSACRTIRCTDIGPIVTPATILDDHPTLFENVTLP